MMFCTDVIKNVVSWQKNSKIYWNKYITRKQKILDNGVLCVTCIVMGEMISWLHIKWRRDLSIHVVIVLFIYSVCQLETKVTHQITELAITKLLRSQSKMNLIIFVNYIHWLIGETFIWTDICSWCHHIKN